MQADYLVQAVTAKHTALHIIGFNYP